MSTISPSLQIGGVNGWKRKEGAVLGWQETSGGLFKPAKFDFSRLSGSASYVDENGLIQIEHRPNYPRFTWQDGKKYLMIEGARINLFLNSETLSTQTVTVSNATEYTVSFRGTGSITFSGGHTGTLNGTGASDKVEVTFTTSSTSVTCTVSGTVEYANFEQAGDASSWIPTTSAAATRNAEVINKTGISSFIGQNEGFILFKPLFKEATEIHVLGQNLTVTNQQVKIEYSASQIKFYLDDVLVATKNGTFDFSSMDEIDLGNYAGASQLDARLFNFVTI